MTLADVVMMKAILEAKKIVLIDGEKEISINSQEDFKKAFQKYALEGIHSVTPVGKDHEIKIKFTKDIDFLDVFNAIFKEKQQEEHHDKRN